MSTPYEHLQTILVTGLRESGRTTFSVLIAADSYSGGHAFWHNSTATFGVRYEDCFLNSRDGLLALTRYLPVNALVLVEEADLHMATRGLDDPRHDEAVLQALQTMERKSCRLILTTVHGRETRISRVLLEGSALHVTCFMNAEMRRLATIERVGSYLIPAGVVHHPPEDVARAMALAFTFRPLRSDTATSSVLAESLDRSHQGRLSTIDQMQYPQHPEYPVFYRSTIIRNLSDRVEHRLSQESILNFIWFESVNKHTHEAFAMNMLGTSLPRWGFSYEPVAKPGDGRFPDGRAIVDGQATNVEVTTIQPVYPSGANLHRLLALSRRDRIPVNYGTPILACRNCRIQVPFPDATLVDPPSHDEKHEWIAYLSGSEDVDDIVAVTPPIDITREAFTRELSKALRRKARIISSQGGGANNWIVILAQGFPVEPEWYEGLAQDLPVNVDGVVVVASETYLGAVHNWEPLHEITTILLKCPEEGEALHCYHPGYEYTVGHIRSDLKVLLPDVSAEYAVYETFGGPLPDIPTHRTLTVRDEQGNIFAHEEGITLSPDHVSRTLLSKDYRWKDAGGTRLTLARSETKEWSECRARVSREEITSGKPMGSFAGVRT